MTIETIETDEAIETIVTICTREHLGTFGVFETVVSISPEGGSLSGRAGGVRGRAWEVRRGGGSGCAGCAGVFLETPKSFINKKNGHA